MRQRQPSSTVVISRKRAGGRKGRLMATLERMVQRVCGRQRGAAGMPSSACAAADPPVGLTAARVISPVAAGVDQSGSGIEGLPRLLLVVGDRRFRAIALLLLTRRGYSVVVGDGGEDIAQVAGREGVEVVVFDATASLTVAARQAARLGGLVPPIGMVAVSGNPRDRLAAMPVISKWDSFDELLVAIEDARTRARGAGTADVGR